MPGGRPSDYDPIYCNMLIEHMSKGFSFKSFAGKIGVNNKTLYNWAEQHEEFFHAKSIGQEKSRLFWEQQGIDGLHDQYHKTEDGMTTLKLNSTVWRLNIMNRFPDDWRERSETKLTGTLDLHTEAVKKINELEKEEE